VKVKQQQHSSIAFIIGFRGGPCPAFIRCIGASVCIKTLLYCYYMDYHDLYKDLHNTADAGREEKGRGGGGGGGGVEGGRRKEEGGRRTRRRRRRI
jgi:hypothetical protein